MTITNQNASDERDEVLWGIAKKRAGFKSHLLSYVLVNIFLWSLWYFTGRHGRGDFPWPMWVTLGWGIGLGFSYSGAYIFPKSNSVQREYEKLKNEQR